MRLLRLIPSDLGRLRAVNYVYRRRLAGSNGALRETQLSDGSRFILEISEWPQAQAYLAGEYDRPTVSFIARNLPSGGVFVDAGAHVGLISFQVLQQVGSASIHAFEPHPRRGEQFKRNRALNDAERRVTLNSAGLSDTLGRVGYNMAWHSIGEAEDSIEVIRLDDYLDERSIEQVDVMKLDIEGHELQALHGAERALSERRIRAITLEAMENHADTSKPRELLEGFGYRQLPLPSSPFGSLRRAVGRGPAPTNEAYLAP